MMQVPGFSGNQTSLNPAGPAAAHIEHTFALIFSITAAVYLLVVLILCISVWRRRYTLNDIPEPQPTSEESDRRATRIVTAAVLVTIALLFVMLISSFRASHALGAMNDQNGLTIDVYGHQWWWEAVYPNAQPYKTVTTANEIHLPIGIPIRIHGTSRDVIHSFWAPNVQGKRDFIPGYDTDIMMQVDKPGRWRGQCAEYCGTQHAHMSFFIVAEFRNDFVRWLNAQAQSSTTPGTPQLQHGQQVFLTHACIMCHTVRGTTAGGRVGPDLSHLASRSTIAAGMLPNDARDLSNWILNAQQLKPGCRMPPNPMPAADLQDLVVYLGSLQ